MDELLCPICLDLLHRPHSLQPCQHLFCEPCLRRLTRARIQKCPVCRSHITDCHLDQELHDSIEDQHQDAYIQRQQAEMNSGIFNWPLPPMRRTALTVAEIVNEWEEESYRYPRSLALLTSYLIRNLLKLFSIIFMMVVAIALLILILMAIISMTVVKIEELILRLMAMIIQLNVQWLRRQAFPGQDRTQQL